MNYFQRLTLKIQSVISIVILINLDINKIQPRETYFTENISNSNSHYAFQIESPIEKPYKFNVNKLNIVNHFWYTMIFHYVPYLSQLWFVWDAIALGSLEDISWIMIVSLFWRFIYFPLDFVYNNTWHDEVIHGCLLYNFMRYMITFFFL